MSLIRRKDPGQAWETEVDSGGDVFQPGSSRITVSVSDFPTPQSGSFTPIEWNFGTPFVFSVGTDLAVVGPDIVFVTAGLYAVHVHIPHGVKDNTDVTLNLKAKLALTCGSQNADGDDDFSPTETMGGDGIDPALSANYIWTQAAGAVLQASIACVGAHDGLASPIAQIVKLSDVAPD